MEHYSTNNGLSNLPLILALNAGGEPLDWINYERSAYYHAKDRVLWAMGEHEVILRGGTNSLTGERSRLVMSTIIALDYKTSPTKYRHETPSLSSKTLYLRDRHICAYCGNGFKKSQLTKDHILPKSHGGDNSWMNLVTACKRCNHAKGNRTPEQANMKLIYIPYVPNFNEHLILSNRNILADQMEFLIKGVSGESRLRRYYEENGGIN